MTPCECCEYPISHRHHALRMRDYGESRHTLQLCPNCHELYHLIYGTLVDNSERQRKMLNAYLEWSGQGDPRFSYLYRKVKEYEEINKAGEEGSVIVVEHVDHYLRRRTKGFVESEFTSIVIPDNEAISERVEIVAYVNWKDKDGAIRTTVWHISVDNGRIAKAIREADAKGVSSDAEDEVKAKKKKG